MASVFQFIVVACCVASAFAAFANMPEEELFHLVDPQCLILGSNVLTFCAKETEKAREFFGVDIGSDAFKAIDINAEVIKQLNNHLGDVSPECCKATCELHNHFCGCGEPMEAIITSFAGSMGFFRQISEAVAGSEKCNLPIYLQEKCPKNDLQKKWKKFSAKGNCTRFSE